MDEFKKSDDELQRLIFDEGKNSTMIPEEEAEIYDAISKVVSEEPEFSLGEDFAKNVTQIAVKRKAFRGVLINMLFKFSIGFLILIVGTAVFYFLANDTLSSLLVLFLAYKFQIIFTLILIIGIQVLDKMVLSGQHKNNISS